MCVYLGTVGECGAILKHIDSAAIVGSVLVDEAAGNEGIVCQSQRSAIGGLVASHDAVAHMGIVGHDGSTAILVDVGITVGKTRHLCVGIATGDEESVDDGAVGDILYFHRHVVFAVSPGALSAHCIGSSIGLALAVEHTVGEGHHMIGVGILLLILIIIIGVEIGGVARDVALIGDIAATVFAIETVVAI